MSFYTSIAIISVAAVFLQAWVGWKFITVESNQSGVNQAIGIFLVLMAMVSMIAAFNIGIQIAETEVGIAQDVTDGIGYQYWAFIIMGFVFLLWNFLVLMFAPIKAAVDRRKLKYE